RPGPSRPDDRTRPPGAPTAPGRALVAAHPAALMVSLSNHEGVALAFPAPPPGAYDTNAHVRFPLVRTPSCHIERPSCLHRNIAMTSPLPSISGLADLAGRYDAVLSDVWGVVHNGVEAFPSAVEALA